jgi:hypothetical protein
MDARFPIRDVRFLVKTLDCQAQCVVINFIYFSPPKVVTFLILAGDVRQRRGIGYESYVDTFRCSRADGATPKLTV